MTSATTTQTPGLHALARKVTVMSRKSDQPIPSATARKQLIAQRMIDVLVRDVKSGRKINGVSQREYADLVASLANYFPGVRTGQVTFPEILGRPSGAGSAKKVPAKKATASQRKPARTRKPATPKVTPATANVQPKPAAQAS